MNDLELLEELKKIESQGKEAKKKVEKIKKEMAEKAYINPEIAEQHKNKGNELF